MAMGYKKLRQWSICLIIYSVDWKNSTSTQIITFYNFFSIGKRNLHSIQHLHDRASLILTLSNAGHFLQTLDAFDVVCSVYLMMHDGHASFHTLCQHDVRVQIDSRILSNL